MTDNIIPINCNILTEGYGSVGLSSTDTYSILRICPRMVDIHKQEYLPVVDIYWDAESLKLKTRYEGPVDDAVKTLMDAFADTMLDALMARMINQAFLTNG